VVVCLEAELQRQILTGLGVLGLPQRLGEGQGPQADVYPARRLRGNRPSLTWPSSRQGNPWKVEVVSTPGLWAASGQGLARRPCNPGPHPSPAESPPTLDPRGMEQTSLQAA